ncbi:hypothetical protein LPJ66_012135, partial [Kickxella alabastrina]
MMHGDAQACNAAGVGAALRAMQREGAAPDAATWTAVIMGMCAAGRLESATKLFALHLEFLPRRGGSERCGMFAPEMGVVLAPEPNLWEQWYAESGKQHVLDPFIWTWMRELAAAHHEGQAAPRKPGGGRGRPQAQLTAPVVPWLPTLATHRIMLKALCRANRTLQAVAYLTLLKSAWPQYGASGASDPAGLRGLERIVHGHLAQQLPHVRDLYGLSAQPTADHGFYHTRGHEILALAQAPGPGPGPVAASASHGSPGDGLSRVERPVYVKALQAYALQGDVPTLLHLMARHAHLNDIAAWTQLVRGVCMQISNSPTDQLLLHPPGTKACSALEASGAAPSWVDFLMNLALALAPRGVVFTQVTFGSIVQVAAQLG